MVLKEAVILEGNAPNSPENVAFHEIVGVGTELHMQTSDLASVVRRNILRQ